MTRVNVGIQPIELNDKHLIAEHREIKRIPNRISKGNYSLKDIPESFKLGKGHVKFFYNKLLYLKKRYENIYTECKNRGFNVTNYISAWDNLPIKLMNDYTPTDNDRTILLQRIKEKNERI
jgi:hypothetical protein